MRLRIVFLLLALGTIAASGMGEYFRFQAEQTSAMTHVEGDLAAMSENLKEQIVDLLSEYQREVRVLVRFEELEGALKNRNPEALAQATRILSHVSGRRSGDVCYLIDGEGNTVASSNYKEPDNFVGRNYSFRPYFSNAMEGRDSIYMGVGVTSNKRGVYFSCPVIVEGSDRPLGVAVIKASIDHIEQIISRRKDGVVLFVHDSGLIFLASRSEWILNTLWRLSDQESTRITATKQFGTGPWKWTGLELKSRNRAVDRSGDAHLINEIELEAYPAWRVVALTNLTSASQRISPRWIERSWYGILGVLSIVTGAVVILFMLAQKDIHKRQQAERDLLASKDDLSKTVKSLEETLAQQKQTEESLRDSEEKYRAFFNTSRDCVFMTTTDGRFIDLNDVALEMVGYARNQREEVLGKKTIDFCAHSEEGEAYTAILAKTGFSKEYPIDLRKQDGTIIHTLITAVARKDHYGNVVGFQGTIRDITERKRVDEKIQRQGKLLSAINSVLQEALEADTDADIARKCLGVAEKMTGSRLGFIGEINQAGSLDTIAVSDPGRTICRIPESDSPSLIRNMEIKGIWGSVLKREESVKVNDPASYPDSAGVPEGHPSLTSFLGVPLKRSGKTFGLIALANKDGGYDDADVADMEALSDAFVGALSRKRAERALQVSEEKYRSIFTNMQDVFYRTDREGNITMVSPSGVKMAGYETEDQMIGLNIAGKFYKDAKKRDRLLALLRKNGTVSNYEVELITRDGTPISVSANAHFYYDKSGQPLGVEGVFVDITSRKRAEEALKDSEQRYRTLFEESIDGVYSVLRDGEITDANGSFCRLFGYSKEEMIGKDVRHLFADPSDHSRCQEEIEKNGFVKDFEVKFRTRAGKELDCLLTSSVHYGKDGNIAGYRGILRDLTIRKKLQKQLLQAQKMEAVGTLAGGVAHDFNNLLQVVIGFSELVLSDENLPDRYRDDLEKVLQAGKTGAELIQRLLMFSRKTEPKPLNLDLNQRIHQIQKFLQRTIPKMIDIELNLADDLARIHADPSQMDQVLMNLSINARDAMSEGGKLVIETENIVIDEDYARTHLDAEPGRYVLLHVSDTGCGMGKETVEHVFEPFFTTKEIGRGTGLGLAMVHGIVKQHNGHITVYSEVGKGTTFNVYFPASQDPTETDLESTSIMPALGTETVLLVDDEDFIRRLGVQILTKHGYTVLEAKNGREALDLFEKEHERISVVILDLIMPEMGGIECLRGLLKIDPKVKILVASGYAADTSVKETIQQGAKGFITKPFRIKVLLLEVRRIIDEG